MKPFKFRRSLASKTSDGELSLACKVTLELEVPDGVRDRCPSSDVIENLDIVVGETGKVALAVSCHAFGESVNGAEMVNEMIVKVSSRPRNSRGPLP